MNVLPCWSRWINEGRLREEVSSLRSHYCILDFLLARVLKRVPGFPYVPSLTVVLSDQG